MSASPVSSILKAAYGAVLSSRQRRADSHMARASGMLDHPGVAFPAADRVKIARRASPGRQA
ncbi:MAG: hypothetical protein KF914_19245 [Rhizobiaceae bacterium]|nr:hypothetical protein [Rhizobiaceae bacterium]